MSRHDNKHDQTIATDEATLAAQGVQAMASGNWPAAERIHRQLEALFPGRHHTRLALSLFNMKHYTEALPILTGLVERGETDLSCILAFAACLERTGDEDRAIRVLESVYHALPNADSAVRLASALIRLGRHKILDKRLPELISAHPGNAQLLSALSEHAFNSGDYAQGFDLMHYRWSIAQEPPKAARLACPAWDGTVFDGELLITAEQGLGDEILASSVFEDLVRLGQRCRIDCDPRLLPVFRRSFPSLRFSDRTSSELELAARSNGCRKIEAAELGRFFRRDANDFPIRTHWLVADPVRSTALRDHLIQKFPGKLLVGISWRSLRVFLGDSKTIPLADLAPLLRLPDIAFIDLQYGDTTADHEQLHAQTGIKIHRLPDLDTLNDIDGLFALVDALDAVVSSSNTTVHIAGALGKSVRTLIPGTRYSLWYWGYDGNHTPWYPTVKLFRGPARKSWLALAEDVAADMRDSTSTHINISTKSAS